MTLEGVSLVAGFEVSKAQVRPSLSQSVCQSVSPSNLCLTCKLSATDPVLCLPVKLPT